jgi:hypothetical protein
MQHLLAQTILNGHPASLSCLLTFAFSLQNAPTVALIGQFISQARHHAHLGPKTFTLIIRIMCGLLSLQLMVAIAHNGLCLQQLFYGFLVAPDPTTYFADQGQPTHVGQAAMYTINVCMRWFSDSSPINDLNL